MCFDSLEHNTIRQWGESYITIYMTLFNVELNFREVEVFSIYVCLVFL
jgi:hypothetical protein